MSTALNLKPGYINKSVKSLYPFSEDLINGIGYLKDKDFSKSDYFIGRNISCLIKLSWTEEEVRKRAKTMASTNFYKFNIHPYRFCVSYIGVSVSRVGSTRTAYSIFCVYFNLFQAFCQGSRVGAN